MLNEKEKVGIRAIVSKMPDIDLKQLAQTVTNRLVVIETADDAINSILMYTDDAVGILGRRKVKKEHIFHYLREMGCPVSPHSDKMTTVTAALSYWESKNARGEQLRITEMEEDDPMQDGDNGQAVPSANFMNPHVDYGGPQVWGSGAVAPPPPYHPPLPSVSNNTNEEVNQMALQFVTWWYPLLNNGHLAQPNQEDNFGPHHFWHDCQVKIHLPQCEHLVEGAGAVSQKLLSLVGQHQLYFNPFDVPQMGIQSYLDPHGLVVVMVAGVLHRFDQPIGTFEQRFGLVRDPSSGNNWKIKFTELRLTGKDLDDLSGGYELEYS